MFRDKTDAILYRLEEKISLPFASVLTGIVLSGLAMLYTSPGFMAHYHGAGYSEISTDPFNFAANQSLQYRILAPLIGYVLFLRGDLFFIVPLIFGALFLAAIYFAYRRKDFSPFESLLMASFMAFSCTILIPLISPAYTDTVSYFFLFFSFSQAYRKKQLLSAFYFLLAVFNHESNFFLLPPLLLIQLFFAGNSGIGEKKPVLKTLLIFALFLIPYFLFRYWVWYNAEVQFSTDFYFSGDNLKTCIDALTWAPVGVFFTFKLLWFFPLYAIHKNRQAGNKANVWIVSSILFFTLSQLIIAYDISRMICLAFPAILLSVEDIRRQWGKEKFISFSQKLMLFNMIILPYFAGKDGLYSLLPFVLEKIIAWCSLLA